MRFAERGQPRHLLRPGRQPETQGGAVFEGPREDAFSGEMGEQTVGLRMRGQLEQSGAAKHAQSRPCEQRVEPGSGLAEALALCLCPCGIRKCGYSEGQALRRDGPCAERRA